MTYGTIVFVESSKSDVELPYQVKDFYYDDETKVPNRYSLYKFIYASVVLFFSFSALVFVYLMSKGYSPTARYQSDTISYIVINEYSHVNSNQLAYPFLKLTTTMEPWRNNTIIVDGLSSVCFTSWSLIGKDSLSEESFFGSIDSSNIFTVIPQKTGFYTLHIVSACGHSSYESSSEVVVKYVRRDLTTLTDNDREEFLDALRVLWDVDTVTGQKLYGDKYKSLFYFAMIHHDGEANTICDEFGGDAGYLNNHILLGAYLEQSLQLVNPRTALHYWEYTRDFSSSSFASHVSNQLDGGAWSDLMTEEYFGTSDPVTGAIINSRWAHSEMPRVTLDFLSRHGIDEHSTFFPNEDMAWLLNGPAHISSPYGFLRGPWNYATRNYTVRFNSAMRISTSEGVSSSAFKPFSGATCSDFQQLIQTHVVGKSMASFLTSVSATTSDLLKTTVGGVGGDRAVKIDLTLRTEYGLSDEDIAVLATASSRFNRHWQSVVNVSLPVDYPNPVSCNGVVPWNSSTYSLTTTAAPGKDGGPLCTVHDFYLTTEEPLDWLMDSFLEDYSSSAVAALFASLSFEQKKSLVALLFSRMQVDGDLSCSGAPTDPLFWVTLGTVDRLFQRVMMEDVLSDKVYATSGEGVNARCQGHDADSSLYWLNGFFFEDSSVVAHELTHRELLAILDPTGEQYATHMIYVYDRADYEWCDGFDNWWT